MRWCFVCKRFEMETTISSIRSMIPRTNGEAMKHVVESCAVKIGSWACIEIEIAKMGWWDLWI